MLEAARTWMKKMILTLGISQRLPKPIQLMLIRALDLGNYVKNLDPLKTGKNQRSNMELCNRMRRLPSMALLTKIRLSR